MPLSTTSLENYVRGIRCWPFRIDVIASPMSLAYELQISLDTRNRDGREERVVTRQMLSYDALVQREIRPVVEALVKQGVRQIMDAHVDAHLRFE